MFYKKVLLNILIQMDFSFLPELIRDSLFKTDIEKVYEIRLREDFAVSIVYDNKRFYLSKNGLTIYENLAIKCQSVFIKEILDNITEFSVYAFNDKIKKGYLTSKEGVRIGVAGECVYDNELITIKNVTSLNIRIPHEVLGCADGIYKFILNNNEINNTLILSPPFCGKTTILKDLTRKINKYQNKSILIIDERGEFSSISGVNIDKIKNCTKEYAFSFGLRSLSPEIVITDELVGKKDWEFVLNAVNSGVKIIASCHAKNMEELKRKNYFIEGVFDRYLVLDKIDGMGKLLEVYDREFNRL